MATTTVDAVTTGLVTLLKAQAGTGGTLAGVQVSDGPPANPERQCLYTFGASEWTASAADMDGSRDESYVIELACEVDVPGDDGATARSRCVAIYAAVEAIVGANRSISGARVDDQLVPRDHAVSPSASGEGFLGVILFGVRVEALL